MELVFKKTTGEDFVLAVDDHFLERLAERFPDRQLSKNPETSIKKMLFKATLPRTSRSVMTLLKHKADAQYLYYDDCLMVIESPRDCFGNYLLKTVYKASESGWFNRNVKGQDRSAWKKFRDVFQLANLVPPSKVKTSNGVPEKEFKAN